MVIIPFIIFFCFVYFGHIFVFWTFYHILKDDLSFTTYIITFLVMVIVCLLIFVSYNLFENLYSLLFKLTGTYLGSMLLIFQFCILYHLINIFYSTSKSISLIIVLAIPLLLAIYGIINVYITKIEKINLHYPGFKGKKIICHLSDIHLGPVYQKGFVQFIVNKIKKLQPDVVVITGDICDGTMRVKADWLSPFDTLRMPILYITGNHEVIHGKNLILSLIEQTNIKYIGNEVCEISGLTFIGVDFEYNLKNRLSDLNPSYNGNNNPNILLCHVPKLKPEELKKFNIFLFLAGHTHGGQIIPFQIPAYLANACFKGLYSSNDNNHVYVSTGIGASVVPMRVGCRSVIGLITIEG